MQRKELRGEHATECGVKSCQENTLLNISITFAFDCLFHEKDKIVECAVFYFNNSIKLRASNKRDINDTCIIVAMRVYLCTGRNILAVYLVRICTPICLVKLVHTLKLWFNTEKAID